MLFLVFVVMLFLVFVVVFVLVFVVMLFLVFVVMLFLVFVVMLFLVFVVMLFLVFVVMLFLVFVVRLRHAAQGQVLGQFHHAVRVGALDQVAEEIGLQPSAIGEHHVGIGHVARIAGSRLKYVRVGAGRKHHVQGDPLAADPAHNVGDDGGGCDHGQIATGPGLVSRRGEQARYGKCECEYQQGGPGQCRAHGWNIL